MLKTILPALLLSAALQAQSWQSAITWGGTLNESVEALLPHPDGSVWIGGSFSGRISLGGQMLTARGEEDMLIVRSSPEGLTPVLHLGSTGQDILTDIGLTPQGAFYAGGSFWQTLDLQDTILSTSRNPKALFIAQFSPGNATAGALEWAQLIEGGSLKELTSIRRSVDGSLFLGGYFSDTLYVDTLALPCRGRSDAFLIKLDAQGKLVWAKRFGGRGDVRIQAVALSAQGAPVIAGTYNDQAILGSATLDANTRDWDIFTASLDSLGEVQWARKAGGVYDDEVYDMITDEQGGIYLTGLIVGVMTLSDNFSIQSQDGNADAFVLKYRADGTPLWAKVLGGDNLQIGLRIRRRGNTLAIAGYYQDNIRLDNIRLPGRPAFNGFLALLDTLGVGRSLTALPGDQPVFPTALAPHAGEGWWIGGVYRGAPRWDNLSLPLPAGGFDAFLAHWGERPTSVSATPTWATNLRIYPNPASDWMQVELPQNLPTELSLWDLAGRLVSPPAQTNLLPVAHLAPGLYLLRIRHQNEILHVQVVVAR